MLRPKIETEDFLLLVFEDWENFYSRNSLETTETLEIRLTQAREIFSFNPSNILGVEFKWIIGLKNFEVYDFIFKTTEKITSSNFIQI